MVQAARRPDANVKDSVCCGAAEADSLNFWSMLASMAWVRDAGSRGPPGKASFNDAGHARRFGHVYPDVYIIFQRRRLGKRLSNIIAKR